ncbi:GntR family transcriptional regulator [Nocardioides albertanoniae]|uniref:GntR family transcriptional regulator n=1 Tax=Nocardioides albertanoniae TaxID=1175486 RepID=A0A543A3B3_9ACTN|nr:GntR family transcriptional regulator [Nocardioides albertanoniae]TQL67073.1 GntR family transcriptional regulator [Nocardioides albertanoniae]
MVRSVAGERSLKHVQIREYVRELLAGEQPGASAPSERDLVQKFSVARATVRQALDALVADGLLVRIPGRGTFVARPPRMASAVMGFSEEMARRGMHASSETLMLKREKAGPTIARWLSVSPGTSVVHWRRLRSGDGVPICIEDVYLDEAIVPGLLERTAPTSLYAELASREMRPTWVDDTFRADVANIEEATLLGLSVGVPVLRRQRRSVASDRYVEMCRSVYRADRYALHLQLGPS